MSYSIEYNSIFLKSKQGITPLILMGDNNVWECDNKRRARSWSCWCNFCGASEDELTKRVDQMLYEQELWMKNGKWVDGNAAARWIRNGIKKACSLEEVLKWNQMRSVTCFLTEYETENYHSHTILHTYCSNNEQFEKWLDEVAEYKKSHGKNLYATISFDREDVHQPITLDGAVVMKQKGLYISDFALENGKACSVSLDRDITHAKVFNSFDEVPNFSPFGVFYPVSATAVKNRKDIVLQILSGPYTNYFIYQCTSKNIRITRSLEEAKKYASKSGAEQAITRIQNKFNVTCKIYNKENAS